MSQEIDALFKAYGYAYHLECEGIDWKDSAEKRKQDILAALSATQPAQAAQGEPVAAGTCIVESALCLSEHMNDRNNGLRLCVSDMTAVMLRMVAGIDHLAELARQWEPDHSSGAERRGWMFAKNARDEAVDLLKELPKRIVDTSPTPPAQPAVAQGAGEAVASIYITPDGDREMDDWKHDLPVGQNILYTQPAAGADAQLLDAMQRHRIAVVPEFEGPWDATVYGDEGEPQFTGSGDTPRDAIRAAIAASGRQE